MHTTEEPRRDRPRATSSARVPALVLAWSADEPHRAGEVFLPLSALSPSWVLGRGHEPGAGGVPRLLPVRQRPGATAATVALSDPALSREALHVTCAGAALQVRPGRAALRVNGRPFDGGELVVGDVLEVADRLVLFIEARALELTAGPASGAVGDFAFGHADAFGLVGESPPAWELRDRIAQIARLDLHTLVLGPSGVGKELVARGLSRAGPRADRPFVARSAATIPHTLIDAELFGNVAGYPNPAMKGRPGLIGAADGGVLYLDEIAELPHDAQAHLLRVLDRAGEYQRLGEATVRRSDLRLVAATHRDPATLKPDLLQRFPLRIEVPGLEDRRADIPLLVNHLVERLRAETPELYARGLAEGPRGPELSLAPDFIAALLMKPRWIGNVRELTALVYAAFLEVDRHDGDGPRVRTPAVLARELAGGDPGSSGAESPSRLDDDVMRAEVRAALELTRGNVTAAARRLGLSNRFALYRVMRRLGIER